MSLPPHPGLDTVRRRLAAACSLSHRALTEINLIVVSKTFPVADIEPVLLAGQRRFGENRVQEAQTKWPQLRESFPDLELHLIGPLQSNKVKEAVALFDVIHTVDRQKIADLIAVEADKQSRMIKIFIQVNIGNEAQKAGVSLAHAAALISHCQQNPKLAVAGLMCIPPVAEDPQPHFQKLRSLAEQHHLKGLSMGMSGDFEVAIAEGATHIRVGSAIFGGRGANPPLLAK